jgi:hypothetical protein
MSAVLDLPLTAERPWGQLAAYGVRSPAEVLSDDADRDAFLIEGVLHSDLTLLYGASEVGKSHLAVSLTEAVIRGGDWFGHPVHRTGRVVILTSDPGGVREYSERLGDFGTDSVGVARPPAPDVHLWAGLAGACVDQGIKLVVLDNLYSWCATADVNKNAEIGRPLSCLDPLIDKGIPVLLVHHTPKDGGKTPAGAHSILAKARHSIHLSRSAMTVHGNSVPEVRYVVDRSAGRVIDIVRGSGSSDARSPVKKPGRRREQRPAQEREALAALAVLGQRDMSQRGLANCLIGKVAGVSTVGQARELLKYMIATGTIKQVGLKVRLADGT